MSDNKIFRSNSKTCAKGFCESVAFSLKIRELERENAELKKEIEEVAKKCNAEYEEQQAKITKLEKVVDKAEVLTRDYRHGGNHLDKCIGKVEAALAELNNNPTRQKQDPPNEKWCVGCSPENCSCCEV